MNVITQSVFSALVSRYTKHTKHTRQTDTHKHLGPTAQQAHSQHTDYSNLNQNLLDILLLQQIIGTIFLLPPFLRVLWAGSLLQFGEEEFSLNS